MRFAVYYLLLYDIRCIISSKKGKRAMSLNKILLKSKQACRMLVEELSKTYEYVSVLGTATTGTNIRVDTKNISVSDANDEYGYVVKIYNGKGYSEYSCNVISEENYLELAEKIKEAIALPDLKQELVSVGKIKEEALEKSFVREDEHPVSDEEAVEMLTKIKDRILAYDELIINAVALYNTMRVSKIFISPNKTLDQYYTWTNVYALAVARREQTIKVGRAVCGQFDSLKTFKECEGKIEETCKLAIDLLDAKPIEPGVYDVITDPSITGLIAHEAFGHGVEMDMFVKNRAKGKDFVGQYVASPLVNMHDGASACDSVASYFFDDDGVLAHDTLIIKEGILQTGISDTLSALQLNTEPTGNGRRESFMRKAYSRMTNTFFSKGTSKVEDMIASIQHGYYLCDTNNGMEDPKNWQIQCTAEYAREIVDGKFSGKLVSPVVISGYVPDVLKSISMVSDSFEVSGSGYCGKGHKEWVRVSDGGPHLKARVKLG